MTEHQTEASHTNWLRVVVSLVLPLLLWAAPGHTEPAASLEPTSGVDVRVNTPGLGETATCDIQSEVSMARHGHILVAGWNDSGACDTAIQSYFRSRLARMGASDPSLGPIPTYSFSGYGWSRDGGATWQDRETLTAPAGWSLLGDPVLGVDSAGTFYYASLMVATDGRSTIGVSRSTIENETLTFEQPVDAAPGLGAETKTFKDKPWLAVDPNHPQPRVYVVFIEQGPSSAEECPGRNRTVWISSSTDGGASFDPLKLWCGSQADAPQVAIGPDGNVYVSWIAATGIYFAEVASGGTGIVSEARDIARFGTDPGHNSFNCTGWQGTPWIGLSDIFELVASGRPPSTSPVGKRVLDGDIRVGTIPSMAVDTYGSADPNDEDYNRFRGHIYLATATIGEPGDGSITGVLDEATIAFLRSTDGGQTWGPLKADGEVDRFFEDAGTTDQFHPQVAVNPDSTVAVSWYDRRLSPKDALGRDTNREIDVYTVLSMDGGQTFTESDPHRITDRSFLPAMTNPNTGGLSGCYMGEYNALIPGDPGEFFLAWGDNRDVAPLTGLPDPNVYFDRLGYTVNTPEPEGPPGCANRNVGPGRRSFPGMGKGPAGGPPQDCGEGPWG